LNPWQSQRKRIASTVRIITGISTFAATWHSGAVAVPDSFQHVGPGVDIAGSAGIGHLMPLPRTPSLRLDGRRALVSGGGRGIGLAAGAALAQAGAHVVFAARTAAEIEAVAAAIRAEGGSGEDLVLDVTDLAAVRAAIAAQGPFDILVNNAGTNRPATFLEVTERDYDAVTNLNLRAAFFVAQAVARGMVQAGIRGSIIQISSQMGHVGGAQRSVYCMSKHGIEGLTKAMAIDLAPHGIRVNTIGPTFIDTPLTQPFWRDKAFHEDVLRRIKLGRLGTVEDLMGAVVYLASDAAALVTGSSLLVDGGWTAE
jgi:NAD(P)-dependent dehydrogenase (short-subunit alcohol dehydrogenase family)